ncbi:Uncharacterised protein [Zhongshania aliphaticivorans]|uniref:Succinylglutamate desuccinylase n=1 Tax=Zhongshania aliphaticivorans TaxID=1470434 RepID=A0A5S9N7V4_9GAMM|nr:DUF1826 domain-containing protein [Zhongshania aliphaticivorans]CAA0080725.1 Uncharacterised protein [Zhongshania aliphaticivorans]CAA0085422.1 Uncharacterised protein [Zhongshania aliphaticivorans]
MANLSTAAMPQVFTQGEEKKRDISGLSFDVLGEIYEPDVNLATWQRTLSDELQNEAESLLHKRPKFSDRIIVEPRDIEHSLQQSFPQLHDKAHLMADLQLLTTMFSVLFGDSAVGVRLAIIDSPMCPKFHVDHVPCRLITAYTGTGTQWLPHDCADRSKLGRGSHGKSDDESGLYASTDHIQQLLPGDVALLKGEMWAGNEGAGLIHRSPAASSTTPRLLLTLDFVKAQ